MTYISRTIQSSYQCFCANICFHVHCATIEAKKENAWFDGWHPYMSLKGIDYDA